MKACGNRLSRLGLSGALLAVLLFGSAASAQDSGSSVAGMALAGTMMLFFLALTGVAYVYMSLALQTIATKTATPNGWLAWIPIAHIFLMLSIAKKPMWWFILFLVPLANIVIAIMVWMAIAEARHKPNWWGIMLIVPVMNLVMPGYLAWAD